MRLSRWPLLSQQPVSSHRLTAGDWRRLRDGKASEGEGLALSALVAAAGPAGWDGAAGGDERGPVAESAGVPKQACAVRSRASRKACLAPEAMAISSCARETLHSGLSMRSAARAPAQATRRASNAMSLLPYILRIITRADGCA